MRTLSFVLVAAPLLAVFAQTQHQAAATTKPKASPAGNLKEWMKLINNPVAQCLVEEYEQVSDKCLDAVSAWTNDARESVANHLSEKFQDIKTQALKVRQACDSDVTQFCPKLDPKGTFKCMILSKDSISQKCTDAVGDFFEDIQQNDPLVKEILSKLPLPTEAVKKACEEDAKMLCDPYSSDSLPKSRRDETRIYQHPSRRCRRGYRSSCRCVSIRRD